MRDLEVTLGDLEWLNVIMESIHRIFVCIYTLWVPNLAYFRSTTSGFRDRGHFDMRDLEVTLGDLEWSYEILDSIDPLYVCIYTLWVPNLAYFRSTTSGFRERGHFDMRDLEVTLGDLEWSNEILDSIDPLYVWTYTLRVPNLAYFCSTTSGFQDRGHFDIRDLEVTLNGQMRFWTA